MQRFIGKFATAWLILLAVCGASPQVMTTSPPATRLQAHRPRVSRGYSARRKVLHSSLAKCWRADLRLQGKAFRVIGAHLRFRRVRPAVLLSRFAKMRRGCHRQSLHRGPLLQSGHVVLSRRQLLRSIPVNPPFSVPALPEGEIAVCTFRGATPHNRLRPEWQIVREFGDPEDLSPRPELNRLSQPGPPRVGCHGPVLRLHLSSRASRPAVRPLRLRGLISSSRAWGPGPKARRPAKRLTGRNKRRAADFAPVLTAFGVDPVNGDVWMCLTTPCCTLTRRESPFRISDLYSGRRRLEGTCILVEENRLLIGADPLGIFEFPRPDRKR